MVASVRLWIELNNERLAKGKTVERIGPNVFYVMTMTSKKQTAVVSPFLNSDKGSAKKISSMHMVRAMGSRESHKSLFRSRLR